MQKITRESAEAVLKTIEADSKIRIEQAGGTCWSRIGDDDDGKVLVIKFYVPKGHQTELADFVPED